MAEGGEISRLRWLLVLTGALLLALVLLTRPWRTLGWHAEDAEPRPITPRGELAEYEKSTAALFDEVSRSVVYINTRARVRNRWAPRSHEVEAGTGSGFVWDADGHIVTNYHVIEEASSAQVVFQDQSAYEATQVGVSRENDLAVLQVHAPPELLRPVMVGESQDLRVGQSAFAIGNPFGLQGTLTTGVVSAKGRQIEGPSGNVIDDVIQIDAAINPGNSGGPLLDSAGRLIGVTSAIYSPSGASAGVSFAIPVDTVNRVVPEIIARGEYRPPQLGIRTNEAITAFVKNRYGIRGVVVLEVDPGSGAATAGLQGMSESTDGSEVLGDVIQQVEGHSVQTVDQLLAELSRHEVGETVRLGIYRDGARKTVPVKLQ